MKLLWMLLCVSACAMEKQIKQEKKQELEFIKVNDINLQHANDWIIDIHDFNPSSTVPKKSIRKNLDKALDRSTKRQEIRRQIEDAAQKNDMTALAQIQNNITMDAFQQLNQALDDMDARHQAFSSRACFWGMLSILGITGQLALAIYSIS